MNTKSSFLEDPHGTQEEILHATYRALCEHGYADLTIQHIGEKFDKSVSLLYQHYDGKDELLLEFLSSMLEEFEESIPAPPADDPAAHLEAILDGALSHEISTKRQEFEAEMVELRAQATYDDRYREQFTRHDQFFQERLLEVIQAGIEDGTFRNVDPERVVKFMFTSIEGARMLRATSDRSDANVKAVRTELDAYLDAMLYATE